MQVRNARTQGVHSKKRGTDAAEYTEYQKLIQIGASCHYIKLMDNNHGQQLWITRYNKWDSNRVTVSVIDWSIT